MVSWNEFRRERLSSGMLQGILEWIVGRPIYIRVLPGLALLGIATFLYFKADAIWYFGWIGGGIALLFGLLAGVLAKSGMI